MQKPIEFERIEEVKLQIVDASLIASSILGIIIYFISLNSYFSRGFEISFITDLLILLSFVLIALFRKKIKIQAKVSIILAGILILVLTDMQRLGVFSADKILLALIPFFSTLTFSVRKILIIYLLALLAVFGIAYLHLTDFFKIPSQLDIGIAAWVINIVLVSIIGLVFFTVTLKFNNTYEKMIAALIQSNNEIKEKEQNYSQIFDSSTDAILIHTSEGKIIDTNQAMTYIFGFEKEEIISKKIIDISSGEENFNETSVLQQIQIAIQNGSHTFDWLFKRKNGDLFWGEVVLNEITIGGEKQIFSVVRDINEKKQIELELTSYREHLELMVEKRTLEVTRANDKLMEVNKELYNQREELTSILEELKSTQSKLVHSEKMASLGVLAAGVAHEINNPLNFIQGGVMGLESFLHEEATHFPTKVHFIIDTIKKGVERAANIVTSLNHFSRQVSKTNEVCDMHKIIDNCLIMLNNSLKNKVIIEKNYTKQEAILLGNEGKLHQAMINIIRNSEQAIKEQGTIYIETKVTNSNLEIKIEDTGCGIDDEMINKITDPFFTTKAPGEGTGLGLSITYNIIKEHGGNLEYISQVGKGTQALITLPLKEEEFQILE